MTARLGCLGCTKWATGIVVASFFATTISSAAFAQEVKATSSPAKPAQKVSQETIGLQKGDQLQLYGENSRYTLTTEKPYKTIEIGNSEILDILPESTRDIILYPLKYGATHVMFYDDDHAMIKDLYVQIEHPIQIGGRFYLCRATGCDPTTAPAIRTLASGNR
jgi:Flp pilus assembly secretin CpaC